MNTCKDCKHWAPAQDRQYGNCTRWLRGYGVEVLPANEVVVEDDEGWAAEMGPDFGCVLWEKKS